MKKVIAVVILGGLIIAVLALRNRTEHSPIANEGSYCSSDGTVTNNKSIQSHRSYCIKSSLASKQLMPNEPVSYQFSIIDDEGNTLKDFKVAHDKLLHLIVVRKDLSSFQHLHPDLNSSTGVFTLPDLLFPTSGEYRIYADFVPTSAQMGEGGMSLNVVDTEDVSVTGNYTPQALSVGAMKKDFDGYEMALSTNPKSLIAGSMDMLSFTIKKDGKLVTDLQPYLAALGHSVLLREDTLEYIHAHAIQEPTSTQSGTIDFHTSFPSGGKYKVFTQFKHNNKVITTEFVILVSGDASKATPVMSKMEGMHHTM